MSYEKYSNYSVGVNSGLNKKIISGLTGLSLLVSGCVDTINGVSIRGENNPLKIKDDGPRIVPPNYVGRSDVKKDNKNDKTVYWIVGGVLLGAGLGTGAYFLNEELNRNRTDDYVPVFGGSEGNGGTGGGGNGRSGPGGQ